MRCGLWWGQMDQQGVCEVCGGVRWISKVSVRCGLWWGQMDQQGVGEVWFLGGSDGSAGCR